MAVKHPSMTGHSPARESANTPRGDSSQVGVNGAVEIDARSLRAGNALGVLTVNVAPFNRYERYPNRDQRDGDACGDPSAD